MSLRQGGQTKLASVMPSVVMSSLQDSSLHDMGVDRFVIACCSWLAYLWCSECQPSLTALICVLLYIFHESFSIIIGLPTAIAFIQRLPLCLRN